MAMTTRAIRLFLIGLLTGFFGLQAASQSGLCPSNLDFEQGDFSGWECRAGSVNSLPLPVTGAIPGRHTIIDASTAGVDPFGGFPTLCPNGSGHSVKLGNFSTGAQAESISYTYTIPSTATNFSMLFYYAVVMDDPSVNHTPAEQPRFQARIVDVATGIAVPCVDFDFVASNAPGGFRRSASTGNGGSPVLYKDWTSISINLEDYIGRTIRLEFMTNDCTRNGHAAYAYVDVFTACNGAIQGTICTGDPSITLTAPFGYQTYKWYSGIGNPFPEPPIATTQSITLNPPPPVGTILPVIVGPFPGFGCDDTLYAVVTESPKPVANAGPDKVICRDQQVAIGSPPVVGYNYAWTPAGQVNNPVLSNPLAGPVTGPTEFIVTVTDLLTGCTNKDTTVVSNYQVDTTVTTTGNTSYCVGQPGASFSVPAGSSPVQWHELTGGPIPGATGISYSPTASGTYWAELSQGGCLDSTGYHVIQINPLPNASFTASNDTGCVINNSMVFTNTSTPNNPGTRFLWRFSDGVTDINADAVRSFTRVGTFNVKLITTSEYGCIDSTAPFDFHIMPSGRPDFTWDSICTGRPVSFTNLSNENGSPQAWYSWDFGNGDPPYTTKVPPPVIYAGNPGKQDVVLKMTTLGCESDTQTVVRQVQVNRQAPGYTYRTITVPEGSKQWLHVRDSIGTMYLWRPQTQLSSYNTRYTEFTAVNDVRYFIDITDPHTCITTDTIQMLVLKKPGFYLPTAFTPNGDGLNDLARPYLIGMKGLKQFSVFNRTGQLIYFTQTYGHGWDGTFRGEKQAPGVYVWILEFYDSSNKLVTEKGTLTLIR